jgi:hypothetical protein
MFHSIMIFLPSFPRSAFRISAILTVAIVNEVALAQGDRLV